MAISYPIDIAKPQVFKQKPSDWNVPLSAANGYRSLAAGVIVDPVHFDPDTGLWTVPSSEHDIDGLLCRPARVSEVAADTSTLLIGPSEVGDASIAYPAGFDRDAVDQRLAELQIIVRPSVLPPD